MKNKISAFFIIILLLAVGISTFKTFQSIRYQTYLLYDFNNDEYNLPYEVYAEKLDDNYPNISLTTIPIKVLKARYYIELDSFETAKQLLYDGIKVNPYLKASETFLAMIYFNEKQFDSSLYYSKDAFYQIPNSNAHRHQYFKNLSQRKDTVELDNAFNMIKEKGKPDHWYEYIVSRYEIVGKNDQKLLDLIKEFKTLFPREEDKINDISKFITIGGQEYATSYLIAEEAAQEFQNKNYVRSAELYEMAIQLNNTEYTFYENAAIAYSFIKDYDNAILNYNEVIYNLKSQNGKSEYLKGLLQIQLNQKDDGCNYLRKAVQKNYIDKGSNINSLTVYNSFCR
tara:strand:+ start:470 stop:1492 length:1023 start_codon:yes stop_codon:yes gene_type:complete